MTPLKRYCLRTFAAVAGVMIVGAGLALFGVTQFALIELGERIGASL
jgi:uncharacterized membrane protein YqgA involved in biofilm formation